MAGNREQDAAAFRDMVLGGTEGGYVPAFEGASAPTAPGNADMYGRLAAQPVVNDAATIAAERARKFRDAVIPRVPEIVDAAGRVAGSGPMAFGAGALGSAAGEQVSPGITRRAGEVALGLPQQREPTGFVRDRADGAGLRPMYEGMTPAEGLTRPDVQASPTLDPSYGRTGGAGGMAAGSGAAGKLAQDAKDARAAQLRTLDDAANLQREMGIDKSGRTMAGADLQEQEAARRQRDAELQQQMDAEVARRHEAFLARSEQLSNEIAAKKIDPSRLLRGADAQTQFAIGLGAALSGALGASNGGGNASLDRLDKMIDRDIAAQVQDMDNGRSQLSARASLFGQMMQETGDRRIAAMQTKKLIYDAMDQKISADSARLGVPEIRTNAEILSNDVEQRGKSLQAQIAEAALAAARAQAAAAASAQRAAEERAWQHMQDLAKLNLEQQKVDIERGKAGGEIEKQVQHLGDKLADKELAVGRAAVDASKRRIDQMKPGEGLPGVSRSGDFRSGLRPSGLNVLNPAAWAQDAAFGLSDQERVARGDWEKMKAAYIHMITGANAPPEERAQLIKSFEGARTPAEQRNSIQEADSFFSQIETSHKASVDPRALAKYEERKAAIRPQLPASAKEGR